MFSSPPPPLTDEQRAEIKKKKELALQKCKESTHRHELFMAELRVVNPNSAARLDAMAAKRDAESKASHVIKAVLGGAKKPS